MRTLLLIGALATLLCGCPAPKTCSAATCSSGCCDSTGTCQSGDSAAACGSGGALCVSCLAVSCSPLRVCMSTGSGGGSGGGTGGGSGGGTGDSGIGGGSGGGGSSDGGLRTVVFSNTTRLLNGTSMTTKPSLGTAPIALYLASGSTLTELPGTRTAAAYTVQNVPAGSYVVRYGTSFYVAQTDTLDVGTYDLGRPDVQLVDAGAATVTLNVSGLPAWGDLDDLQFFSEGANFYGYGIGGVTSGPAAGMVPTRFDYDYGLLTFGEKAPRVDATRGDSMWAVFMQNRALITTPVPGAAEDGGTLDVPFNCVWATSSVNFTNVTITPGTNTVAASFTAAPDTSLGLIFPRTQWAARASETHPAAVLAGESLYFVAQPAPNTASADLLSCFNDARFENPVSDINRSITTGNPFPAAWPVLANVSMSYRMAMMLPDAGSWSSTGISSVQVNAGDPLTPGVHPPRSVIVQGTAADQVSVVVAASPLTVSWAAPASGPAPTHYLVHVLELTKTSGAQSRKVITSALTRGTSFTFPAGTLTVGSLYQLRVRARLAAGGEEVPFLEAYRSIADAITNPFVSQ